MSAGGWRWRYERSGYVPIVALIIVLFSGFTILLALAIALYHIKARKAALPVFIISLFVLTVLLDLLVTMTGAMFFLCLPASLFYLLMSMGVVFRLRETDEREALGAAIVAGLLMAGGYGAIFGNYYYPKDLSYDLDVRTDTSGEYALLVPFFDELRPGQDTLSMQGVRRIGNGVCNMTPLHSSGKALLIVASGRASIHASVAAGNDCAMTLRSSPYEDSGRYWVYCDKKGAGINISISISASHDYHEAHRTWSTYEHDLMSEGGRQFLEDGWNIIKIQCMRAIP